MTATIPHTLNSETPPAATSGVSNFPCLTSKKDNDNAYHKRTCPKFNPDA